MGSYTVYYNNIKNENINLIAKTKVYNNYMDSSVASELDSNIKNIAQATDSRERNKENEADFKAKYKLSKQSNRAQKIKLREQLHETNKKLKETPFYKRKERRKLRREIEQIKLNRQRTNNENREMKERLKSFKEKDEKYATDIEKYNFEVKIIEEKIENERKIIDDAVAMQKSLQEELDLNKTNPNVYKVLEQNYKTFCNTLQNTKIEIDSDDKIIALQEATKNIKQFIPDSTRYYKNRKAHEMEINDKIDRYIEKHNNREEAKREGRTRREGRTGRAGYSGAR